MEPPAAPPATPPIPEPRREAAAGARALDPEWDEVFAWSYGPRGWNIGCG